LSFQRAFLLFSALINVWGLEGFFCHLQEVADSFRARVLRAQQNRLPNRLLPFQGSGGFGVGAGFVKESGGTGVFIPRTLNTTTTKNVTATDIRKKRGELAAILFRFFFLVLFLTTF
jgi:hypothetical protein